MNGAFGGRRIIDDLCGVVGGHGLGHGDERALGGAIGDAAGGADGAELGGDVDDGAAAGGDHVRDRPAAHEEGAAEVGREDLVPGREVEVEHRGGGIAHGGAVHQDVEAG